MIQEDEQEKIDHESKRRRLQLERDIQLEATSEGRNERKDKRERDCEKESEVMENDDADDVKSEEENSFKRGKRMRNSVQQVTGRLSQMKVFDPKEVKEKVKEMIMRLKKKDTREEHEVNR